ncbi:MULTISPECIES: hypothetical protein [Nitrosopumilus]|uniref:Uncharacterized protein n=1 Tax=Nitrosopumilus piranensis TaxID=1582439 RepID=A0A0C5BPE1_9ARCH|nr:MULTISPECIES: hypothetical protein [Nitrosopumilus]AJM91533.1 conserved exported protein of unknown function [Nitrosopumilus piranensis]KAF6246104.1 hypothetical protein C6989_02420 [Nitrosopumilus sp. b2]
MRYLFVIILLSVIFATPAFAQEVNPSLIIDTIEIPAQEFNRILRDAPIVQLDDVHAVSWQVTIDNNLIYANPNGNAVFRLYDANSEDEFIEVGMGSIPDNKFWVAVQTPKEGYIVVHSDLERGWYPQAKSIISFTDRAGLTVNNGARIVVTNLDIGEFAIGSYSVHGMEGSTDPPAVNSGSLVLEFLSGDPSKNAFAMFPFYVAAGIGVIVGVLFLTKKRS